MQATLEKPTFRPLENLGEDLRALVPDGRTILDIGAGRGYWARNSLRLWPTSPVFSVEPNQDLTELQGIADDAKGRLTVSWCALGDESAMRDLYLTHGRESSSFLEFLPGGPLEVMHRVRGTARVPMKRLDDWAAEMGIKPVSVGLLKMDVQGFELKVLEGAEKLLNAKPAIFCEVSFTPSYQNHPLLEDVDAYLADHGYRRLHLYPSPHPELWGDALYVPAGTTEYVANSSGDKFSVPSEEIRLNIGAGNTVIPGFTAIDRRFGTEAFPLLYPDNSISEIRCVHMLEHLSFGDVSKALAEWHRVLKPGATLRISVPDVRKVLGHDDNWRFHLMGGQMDDNDFHRSAFDEDLLRRYMNQAGFSNIVRWTSENTDLAAAPFSLNLEGTKEAGESGMIKIRAVVGLPRIGWNDSWQSIIDALRPFEIPIETHQGCFWAQNMQKALSRALRDGIDWVITLDYDSLVLPFHVQRLLEILGSHPEIDAISALQMRRGAETPLFSTGKTEQETDGSPIRVNTAHFGLTALRVECLANMEKPWLIDVPDSNGEFDGQHTDADITFWKKWIAAGHTVYCAPDVKIGHLELLVSEFDEDFKPRHFHVGDWWNRHAKAGHCMRSRKEA